MLRHHGEEAHAHWRSSLRAPAWRLEHGSGSSTHDARRYFHLSRMLTIALEVPTKLFGLPALDYSFLRTHLEALHDSQLPRAMS